MPKLTGEERIRRAKELYEKLEQEIATIDQTTGQKRGQAYRRANSLVLKINRLVSRVKAFDEKELQEAKNLFYKANGSYNAAWKRHHQ